MKSFSHFLPELNDGQNNAQLSGHFAELLSAVKTHGLAGSLREKSGYTVFLGTP